MESYWKQFINNNFEDLLLNIDYDNDLELSLDAFVEFGKFVDTMRMMYIEASPVYRTTMLLDFIMSESSDSLFEILCQCLANTGRYHVVNTYLTIQAAR